MTLTLGIDDVARRTGLTVHTLRYYERIGLIAAVGRAPGGQRRYAEADLDWIAFLLRLRATNMPIRGMREFARLRACGDATVPQRRALLEEHLGNVNAQVEALQRASQVLSAKIAHYRAIEARHDV